MLSAAPLVGDVVGVVNVVGAPGNVVGAPGNVVTAPPATTVGGVVNSIVLVVGVVSTSSMRGEPCPVSPVLEATDAEFARGCIAEGALRVSAFFFLCFFGLMIFTTGGGWSSSSWSPSEAFSSWVSSESAASAFSRFAM